MSSSVKLDVGAWSTHGGGLFPGGFLHWPPSSLTPGPSSQNKNDILWAPKWPVQHPVQSVKGSLSSTYETHANQRFDVSQFWEVIVLFQALGLYRHVTGTAAALWSSLRPLSALHRQGKQLAQGPTGHYQEVQLSTLTTNPKYIAQPSSGKPLLQCVGTNREIHHWKKYRETKTSLEHSVLNQTSPWSPPLRALPEEKAETVSTWGERTPRGSAELSGYNWSDAQTDSQTHGSRYKACTVKARRGPRTEREVDARSHP